MGRLLIHRGALTGCSVSSICPLPGKSASPGVPGVARTPSAGWRVRPIVGALPLDRVLDEAGVVVDRRVLGFPAVIAAAVLRAGFVDRATMVLAEELAGLVARLDQ